MTRSTPAKDQTMALNVPNLDRLISYLEALPPEEFNMGAMNKSQHPCGTACCIAGHQKIIFGTYDACDFDCSAWSKLIMPEDWSNDRRGNQKYPLHRAIRMLRHLRAEFLRTGLQVVDWDAPGAVEAPLMPWAPPVVIGADKPLPDALTSLLRDPAGAELVPHGDSHGC